MFSASSAPLPASNLSKEKSLLAKLAFSSPERSSLERNALNSELNEDSVEDSDDIISPDEWKQHQDDRKRIVVGTRYPIRNQNQNQEADETSEPEVIDLTGDIAINEMLADKSIPLHPDVEVFAPNRRRPVQQDPMQSFPAMFPTFPQQPFPGVNRFRGSRSPQNPMFGGGQFPGGQQFPVQRPANVPIGGGVGGFGQQTPVLMMTFPPGFPAIFREVRP
ncbi:hypothetical protein pipiens_012163 [Culex pipiens pipiens]|uniref:Uncharacterized protein n=1 Tax=Culex pipiens pipiens TaxID=38569 RepID=A0ABD1D3F7_CULPP